MRARATVWRPPATARPAIRSTAVAVFGNAMTSRIDALAGEHRDDTVEPERDAAVRRRAVLERLEEEAEAQLRLLVADAEPLEDARLQRGVVDSDAAAADLRSRSARGRRPWRAPRPDRSRACRMSSSSGDGERVVHRIPAAVLAVPFEQRKIGDPEELERVRVAAGSPSSRSRGAAGRAASTSSSGRAGGHQQQIVRRAPRAIERRPQRRLAERLDRAERRLARAAPRSGR